MTYYRQYPKFCLNRKCRDQLDPKVILELCPSCRLMMQGGTVLGAILAGLVGLLIGVLS